MYKGAFFLNIVFVVHNSLVVAEKCIISVWDMSWMWHIHINYLYTNQALAILFAIFLVCKCQYFSDTVCESFVSERIGWILCRVANLLLKTKSIKFMNS